MHAKLIILLFSCNLHVLWAFYCNTFNRGRMRIACSCRYNFLTIQYTRGLVLSMRCDGSLRSNTAYSENSKKHLVFTQKTTRNTRCLLQSEKPFHIQFCHTCVYSMHMHNTLFLVQLLLYQKHIYIYITVRCWLL